MNELHPHQQKMLDWISLEVEEQNKRYRIDGGQGLKFLRSVGALIHPLNVTRKSFGYADYPEISFRIPYPCDTSNFKDNSAIECFVEGEEPVKGIILYNEGKSVSIRLYAPDFPDWIEDKGVGVKLAVDHYSSECMSEAVHGISDDPRMSELFGNIHGNTAFGSYQKSEESIVFHNQQLNESQQSAVRAIRENQALAILHGPPGTGKTTTLLEGILQLVQEGKRILVTAPSNTAVDNVAKGLIQYGTNILRVGNTVKVDSEIYPHTPEGKLKDSKERKEIKNLKIRAEELRKMAVQYKRSFGKSEREQRSLLFREVKTIRKEIRDLREYAEEKLFEHAEVILGTPIGILNSMKKKELFDVLVMDEAGQCLEPMAWVVFPLAKSWVLAGDPFQLPPTVLSNGVEVQGMNVSILESAFKNCEDIFFLDTQYRMRSAIAEFSNQYFYEGKLRTPDRQADSAQHVLFFDTAGTGFEEESGTDGTSLTNSGELDLVQKWLEENKPLLSTVAVISPYSGQVNQAKDVLPKGIRVSTVDSFQGQEMETVIVSLVRSNSDAVIGFLKDYRRMNVAMTRAKEKLIVIGDSATIGQDSFYAQFLEYVEKTNGYHSAWELLG